MNFSDQQSPARKVILCVEDNKDNCELIALLLAEYEVVFAQTVAEALQLFAERRFDLCLMDNWLPDGSGIELCRAIRLKDADVPIVFVSGVDSKPEIQKAHDAGAVQYLVKPYEPEKLRQVVKQLLENQAIS